MVKKNSIFDVQLSKSNGGGGLMIYYILYTIFKGQWDQTFEEPFHLKQKYGA